MPTVSPPYELRRTRDLRERQDDEINPRDFGALGDGVNDDYQALQQAASIAGLLGRRFKLKAGTYLCSGQLTFSGHTAISGDGISKSRIVFTAATGGIAVTLTAQGVNTPPQQLHAADFTIESRAAVTSPALAAAWSAYQANAQGSVWIDRVHVTRANDGTGSFAAGIRLTKAFIGQINDCVVLGDDARVSVTGLDLIDCVGIRCKHCDVNRYQTGAKARVVAAVQTEGLQLTDCALYDVNVGVDVINGIHVSLIGTHVNINGAAADKAIYLKNVSQSFVCSCLVYYGGTVTDPATQQGIVLEACNAVMVANNGLNAVTPANGLRAILLFSSSGYCTVVGNNISFGANGICFNDAGTDYNQAIGNQFYTVTNPIVDAGPSNHKALNLNGNVPISGLRWGAADGSFRTGELSANAQWGAFLKGYSGTSADIALADSGGNVGLLLRDGSAKVRVVAKAALPLATAGGVICVSDDVGGFTLAFADGANWRRVADRAIIA